MNIIFFYLLGLLCLLYNNIFCIENKNELYILEGHNNLTELLALIACDEHRDIYSEDECDLLNNLSRRKTVTKEELLRTLNILEEKCKNILHDSEKDKLERLIDKIKDALKKNNFIIKDDKERKKKTLNKSTLLLKLENSLKKKDLANFKKVSDLIKLRNLYLHQNYRICSSSNEKLLLGIPRKLHVTDWSVKTINLPLSFRITNQISTPESFCSNTACVPLQYDKSVKLFKPLLDFNLEQLENDLKSQLKTYEESKKEISFLIREKNELKRVSLDIPSSRMPQPQPNDELKESLEEGDKILTYVISKRLKGASSDYTFSIPNKDFIHFSAKKIKKTIQIPKKQSKDISSKKSRNKVIINVKSPIKMKNNSLKKRKAKKSRKNNNNYHIFIKGITQKQPKCFTKVYDIPIKKKTVIKPVTNNKFVKKVIIKKVIQEVPVVKEVIKEIQPEPKEPHVQNCPQHTKNKCGDYFYAIPLIKFYHPSGSIHCLSCSQYEKNSPCNCALDENFIKLKYGQNCMMCIPTSVINHCFCNMNNSKQSIEKSPKQPSDTPCAYSNSCSHKNFPSNYTPKNNNVFSTSSKHTSSYNSKLERICEEKYNSKLVQKFYVYNSSKKKIFGKQLSKFTTSGNSQNNYVYSTENSDEEESNGLDDDEVYNAKDNNDEEDNDEEDSDKENDEEDNEEDNNEEKDNDEDNNEEDNDEDNNEDNDEDDNEDNDEEDNDEEDNDEEDNDEDDNDEEDNDEEDNDQENDDEEDNNEEDNNEGDDKENEEGKNISDNNVDFSSGCPYKNFVMYKDKHDENGENEVTNNLREDSREFIDESHEIEDEYSLDANDDNEFIAFNESLEYNNNMQNLKKNYYNTIHRKGYYLNYDENEYFLIKLRFIYKTSFFTSTKKEVNAYLKTPEIGINYNKQRILYLISKFFSKSFKHVNYKINKSKVHMFPIFKNSRIQSYDLDFGKIKSKYAISLNMFKRSVFDLVNNAIYFISPDGNYILLEDVIKRVQDKTQRRNYNFIKIKPKLYHYFISNKQENYTTQGNDDTESEATDVFDEETTQEEIKKDDIEENKINDTSILKALSDYDNVLSQEDIKMINEYNKNVIIDKKNINGEEITEITIKKDESIFEKEIVEENIDGYESITIDSDESIEDVNETAKKYINEYFSIHNMPIHYIENFKISKNVIYISSDVNSDLNMLKMSIIGMCNIIDSSIDDFRLCLANKETDVYDYNECIDIPESINNIQELNNYSKSLNMKIVIAPLNMKYINIIPRSFDYLYNSNEYIHPSKIYEEEKEKDKEKEKEGRDLYEEDDEGNLVLKEVKIKKDKQSSLKNDKLNDNIRISGTSLESSERNNEQNYDVSTSFDNEEVIEYENKEISILEDEELYKTNSFYKHFELYIDNPNRKIDILNAPILKVYTFELFIADIMNKTMHVPSIFTSPHSYKKGLRVIDTYLYFDYYTFNKNTNAINSLTFEKNIPLYEVLKELKSRNEGLMIKNKDSEEGLSVDNLRDMKIPSKINLADSRYIHFEIPIFYLDEDSNFFQDKIILRNIPETLTINELCSSIKNIINETLISFKLNLLEDLHIYTIRNNKWENVLDKSLVYDLKTNNQDIFTIFINHKFLTKNDFQILSNISIDFVDNSMYAKKLDIYIEYHLNPYTLYNVPINMSSKNIKCLFLNYTDAILTDSFLNEFYFTYNKKNISESNGELKNTENVKDEDIHVYEGTESVNNEKIPFVYLLSMITKFYKVKLNSTIMVSSLIANLYELCGKSSNEHALLDVIRSSKTKKNIELTLYNNSKKILVKNVPSNLLLWQFINVLMRGSFNIPIEDKDKLYNLFTLVPDVKEGSKYYDYFFLSRPGYTVEEAIKSIQEDNLYLVKAYPEELNHISDSEHFNNYSSFRLDSLPSVIDFENPNICLSFYTNYNNENKITYIRNIPLNTSIDTIFKSILLNMYSYWGKLPEEEKIKFSLFINNNEIKNFRDYLKSEETPHIRTLLSLNENPNNNISMIKHIDLHKYELESGIISEEELGRIKLYDSLLREVLLNNYIDYNNIDLKGYKIDVYVYDGISYKPTFIHNVPLNATNKDIINFLLNKSNHINNKQLIDQFLLLNKESFDLLKLNKPIRKNVVFLKELIQFNSLEEPKLYLVHRLLFNPLDNLFQNIVEKSYDFKSENASVSTVKEERGKLSINVNLNNRRYILTVLNIPYSMCIIQFLRYAIGYQRQWIYKFVKLYIIKGDEKHVLNDNNDTITYGRTVSEIFEICKTYNNCTIHIDVNYKNEVNYEIPTYDNINEYEAYGSTNFENTKMKNIILNELSKKIIEDEIQNKNIDLSTLCFEYNAGIHEKTIFGSSRICNIPREYTVGNVLSYIKKRLLEDAKIKITKDLQIMIIINKKYVSVPSNLNIVYAIHYLFNNTPSIVCDSDDGLFNIVHLTLYKTFIDMKNNTFVKRDIEMHLKKGNYIENINFKHVPINITEDDLITYLLRHLTKSSEVTQFMRDNTSICLYPRCDPIYIHHKKKQIAFIPSLVYHNVLKNIYYITTVEAYENFYARLSHKEYNFEKSQIFKNTNVNRTGINEVVNIDINIHLTNIYKSVRVRNLNINITIEDLLSKIFKFITTRKYNWNELFTFVGSTSKDNILKKVSKSEEPQLFRDCLNAEENLTFIFTSHDNEIHDYFISKLAYLPALINYQTNYVTLNSTINGFENKNTTLHAFPDYLTSKTMLTILQYSFFKLIGKTYLNVFGCSYDNNLDATIEDTSVEGEENGGLVKTLKDDNDKQQMKFILRVNKNEKKKLDTIKDLVNVEINIGCQALNNAEDMEECLDLLSSLNNSSIFWRNGILGFMANSITIRDTYNNSLVLPNVDFQINEKILLQNVLYDIDLSPYLYKLFYLSHIDKKCNTYEKFLKNSVPHIQCLLSYGFNIYFDLQHDSKLESYDGFKTENDSFDITQIHSFSNLLEQHFVELTLHNDDGTYVIIKNVYRDMTVGTFLNDLSKARFHIHGLRYNETYIFYKLVYLVNDEINDISTEDSIAKVNDIVLKFSKSNIILKVVKNNNVKSYFPNMYLSPYPSVIDLSQNNFQVSIFLPSKNLLHNDLLREQVVPSIIINNVPSTTLISSLKELLQYLIEEFLENAGISENLNIDKSKFDIKFLVFNFNPFTKKTQEINSNILNNLSITNFYNIYINGDLVLQLDSLKQVSPDLYNEFINHFSKVVIDFSNRKVQLKQSQ
ncbi:liver specific protein 1, putative [Plasmodium gallinaceum]|uniref:Liver specific protein 1, putative n=1 Tax=Plasmodium gallinaceum TaxID=5849 RepID=A0A1J1GT64_PLAGA|nr:liver specific protein 1, putative [Plasmodium gallinaceum]CRG95700.1 liver specific protein 1, putative [Plasmodium gallinaceum]